MTNTKSKPRTMRVLTVAQLRDRWGISNSTAYDLQRILPTLKIGASIRYPLDAIERFERSQLGYSLPNDEPSQEVSATPKQKERTSA